VTTIRLATDEDREALVTLGLEFHADSRYRVFQATRESIGVLFDTVMGTGEVFMAEVDGVLVGMLAIVMVPVLMSGEMCADEIAWFVRPAYRGGSVGPRLLHAAEEWAMQNHANVIRMVAPEGTDVGLFYERCGYTPIETGWMKGLHGTRDGHRDRRARRLWGSGHDQGEEGRSRS